MWTHDGNSAHHAGTCVSLVLCQCDTATPSGAGRASRGHATQLVTQSADTVSEAVPAAVTDPALVQGVLTTLLEPATTDVSTAAVGALVNPSAGVLVPADSIEQPADNTLVTAQASATAQSAYASNTLGIGFSGSGFLVSQEQR